LRKQRIKEVSDVDSLINLIKNDISTESLLFIKKTLRRAKIDYLLEFVREGGVDELINLFTKYEYKFE
jgi:hypothetical protein